MVLEHIKQFIDPLNFKYVENWHIYVFMKIYVKNIVNL